MKSKTLATRTNMFPGPTTLTSPQEGKPTVRTSSSFLFHPRKSQNKNGWRLIFPLVYKSPTISREKIGSYPTIPTDGNILPRLLINRKSGQNIPDGRDR